MVGDRGAVTAGQVRGRKGTSCYRVSLQILLGLVVISWLAGEAFLRSKLYGSLFVASGRILSRLLPEKVPPAPAASGYNYDVDKDAWLAHPESLDWADVVPPFSGLEDKQQTARAAVFFVYPTGYFGTEFNAPINSSLLFQPFGVLSDLIADTTAMIHASIYNSAGRVFIPRYRQISGWVFMLDDNDSRKEEALNLALDDVLRAFEHFLKVNTGSPVILAGHSQGSMLLCRLLKKRYHTSTAAKQDPSFDQLVAAYLLGADLSPNECGEVVTECKSPTDLRCFVHFNAFMEGGDRGQFLLAPEQKNLSCVNPLSFRADEVAVPPEANPGSRPILRPSRAVEALLERFWHRSSVLTNLMSPLEKGQFGAQCSQGVVWVNQAPNMSGYWLTGVFPGMNIHGGESSFFYVATRLNAELRLQEHFAKLQET